MVWEINSTHAVPHCTQISSSFLSKDESSIIIKGGVYPPFVHSFVYSVECITPQKIKQGASKLASGFRMFMGVAVPKMKEILTF